jgi:hypothetical protein
MRWRGFGLASGWNMQHLFSEDQEEKAVQIIDGILQQARNVHSWELVCRQRTLSFSQMMMSTMDRKISQIQDEVHAFGWN